MNGRNAKAPRGFPTFQVAVRQAGGQALIETCLVMGVTCLIFFGILQVARLFAAREVLYHAASCGARARAVGLNRWMVEKAIRVAAIPNAGRMTEPVLDIPDPRLQVEMRTATSSGNLWERLLRLTPFSLQYALERVRIPEYLASENEWRSRYILKYSDWNTIHGDPSDSPTLPDGRIVPHSILHIRVRQEFPLTVPLHRTFYADDTIPLHGEAHIENHFALYLDERNW